MPSSPRALLTGARSTSSLWRSFPPALPGRSTARRVAYVGWSGNGNLGDDAMLAAHRLLLPRWDVAQVPNAAGPGRLGAPALRRASAVCLGGGTLILNGHFRETLERVVRTVPDLPRVMLSVGVEDLGFRQGRRAGVGDEVVAWRPLLAGFERVRVRGPLSRHTVEAMGLEAVEVGDPALALPDQSRPDVPRAATSRSRIGVNFGLTDDLWGGDHAAFRAVLVAGVRALVAAGHEVVLLATTTADREHLVRVQRECAGFGVLVQGPNEVTLAALDEALRDCTVVVGEKLHALVLAARLGVPTLALEYRPKCRDFQLSVGRGQHVVRTDELTVDSFLAFVADGLATVAADRPALRAAVAERVRGLQHAAECMRLTMAGAA